MKGFLTGGTALAVLALAVSGQGAAMAQDAAAPAQPASAPAAAAGQPNGGLADIVVTAERREGQVQKTPIAMSVFTPAKLTQNNVTNLQTLITIAPSVNFGLSRSQVLVSIRGISSRDGTEIGDPAVSISTDGFYYQRAIGLNDSQFDLERVEVLRGPQGTLYGRNATGGAINFITAKPVDHFEGSAKFGYGNFDDVTTEGMINVPVTDWFDVRASFATHNHKGYRNNAPSQDADDADSQAGRVHFLFKPTNRLKILLTAEYSKIGGVGPSLLGEPLQLDSSGHVIHVKPALPSNDDYPLSTPSQYQDGKSQFYRGTIEYDLGGAKITYLGGYHKLHFIRFSDFDGRLLPYYVNSNETIQDKSQEIRLSSNNTSPFVWQIGGFWFKENNNLYSVAKAFPYFSDLSTGTKAGFVNYFRYPNIVIESKAVFGQASYNITDALKVEGGIRYTSDRKKEDGVYITATGNPLNTTCVMPGYTFQCPGPLVTQHSRYKGSKVNYHAALNYQVTPRNLVYAKFDTGYKAGGFNQVSDYGPENLTAYEIGSKNRFLDNHLQINVSAFYYKDKNLQVPQLIQGRTFTVNAGRSEFYGGELEASAILGPNDRIDGSASYLHAEFTDFLLAVNGVNQQLAGNTPPQAPRFTFSVGYEHDFHLFHGTLTPRLQTHHETHSFQQVNNYPTDRQDAYWRSDAYLNFKPDEGNWDLQLYMRNIEDVHVLTWAQERPAPYNSYTYQFDAPRTFGFRVGYHF